MNVYEKTRLLLSGGALLKVIFNREDEKVAFTLTCETTFYKELGFKTNVTEKYIDVLRDLPFTFDNLTLHGFDCFDIPVGTRFEDFIPNSFMQKTFGKQFLKSSKEYIAAITDRIKMKKAEFTDRCIGFLDKFNLEVESNRNDLTTLMFYPYEPIFLSKDKQLEAINKNIVDLYHLLSEKNTNILPALVEIGVSTNSILECENLAVVNAVKAQWFNLIQYEKNLEQQRMNSIKNSILQKNKCTADYLEQFQKYDSMLTDINKDIFNSCKTIKDIITIWPAALQPQPWYVYEN